MSAGAEAVLAALTDEWRTTREVAADAGLPIRYGSYTTVYHILQKASRAGTAEQRIVKEDGRIRRAQWRRPQ